MIIGTMRPEEARIYDQWEGFHEFHSEETQETYGSFEILWMPEGNYMCFEGHGITETYAAGWYWQAGFPGCLPDSDPSGPFAMSRDALEDADEWHPEFDE